MDLALPLRSLVPSLDADVLAVLAGTESELGISAIVRLAGRGSRAGAAHVLDRLVLHGLVHARRGNIGYLYSFNREHVLAPLVTEGLEVRQRVLVRLADEVKGLGPLHASVFGSFARGEGNAESDIDLFIVVRPGVDPHGEWSDRLRAVQDRVEAFLGNGLEPLVMTVDGLTDVVAAEEPIVGSLREESITLAGPDFGALMTSVRAGAA